MLPVDWFDFPLGTAAERRSRSYPPADWHVSNGYMNYYFLGPNNTNPAFHTGIDITREPYGGYGSPIYAIANGEIVYAKRVEEHGYTNWGNLIIQRCVMPDGKTIYVRYAHEAPLFVSAGDTVLRGEMIADVSNAFGVYYPHLHLDISPTSVLRIQTWNWPGLDDQFLKANYLDPLRFIKEHGPMGTTIDQIKALLAQASTLLDTLEPAPPPPVPAPIPTTTLYVTATAGLRIHTAPNTQSPIVTPGLTYGGPVVVEAQSVAGTDETGQPSPWGRIAAGQLNAGAYVIEKYLSPTRPQ